MLKALQPLAILRGEAVELVELSSCIQKRVILGCCGSEAGLRDRFCDKFKCSAKRLTNDCVPGVF